MGASSVTGVSGPGACNKATLNELSQLANGPTILLAGRQLSSSELASPGGIGTGTVTFPNPLPGLGEEYVIVLTTLNGGYAYVTDLDDDEEEDHFTGFSFTTETEGYASYIVVKNGIRASI